MSLSEISIHAWIQEHDIRNEQGMPLDFKDHLFLFDVYADDSPNIVCMKAAQIGFSTLAVLKSLWVVKNKGFDVIYTLPTEGDRNIFVGSKVNRIIAQNGILQEYVADKDSIEQKQVGTSVIHYRGTWTQKSATMVPSDMNIYDEVDASKPDVVEQYSTRLQHSKNKWEWWFSHPSADGFGVHIYWKKSDQKHWFIQCTSCKKEQFMSWPESIDIEKEIYICKHCGKELTTDERRNGYWKARFKKRKISGYWIPLLICPWISAAEVVKYYREKSPEYFYNKVLGLPYVGGGNKLTWQMFAQNLTLENLTPDTDERVILGIDTGNKLDYVIGSTTGLFFHGETTDYAELDKIMERWPKAVAVIDAGGDLIGSRAFAARWKGRVILCFLRGDRKTKGLITFGTGDEQGTALVDRNRMIQLTVDEFREGRIPVQGTEGDWMDYWNDWNNLSRIKVIDPQTQENKGYKWIRSGRDHRALATVFWRVGVSRFIRGQAKIISNEKLDFKESPEVSPRGTIIAPDPKKLFISDETAQKDDWRHV